MLYRIYRLNAADRIESAVDLDCESDADAVMEAARRLGKSAGVEVWYGAQRVRHMWAIEAQQPFTGLG
jgi:hypothetical protein